MRLNPALTFVLNPPQGCNMMQLAEAKNSYERQTIGKQQIRRLKTLTILSGCSLVYPFYYQRLALLINAGCSGEKS